jgi:hypothetical protein
MLPNVYSKQQQHELLQIRLPHPMTAMLPYIATTTLKEPNSSQEKWLLVRMDAYNEGNTAWPATHTATKDK